MTWSWKEGVYRSWFIRGTRRFRIIFGTISDTLTETFIFFSFFTEWSYEIGLRLIWRMTLSSLSRNKISPSRISEEDFPLLRQEGGIIEEETEKNIGTLDYLWLKFHFCKKKKKMVTHVVSPSIQLLCFLRFTRTSSSAPGASPSTPKIHVLRDTFHRNRVQAPVGCAPSIRPFINVETMK